MTFERFIQTTLKGDKDFRANPHRFKDLEMYLSKYNEDAFPELILDLNILSFSDGILLLSENTFIPYNSSTYFEEHSKKVARHHIMGPYGGLLSSSTNTPLFDSVMMSQFNKGDGRLEMMYALIGRLFFKVGQLDNWQVMVLLLGQGGTGKSTIFKVIDAMFRPSAIAEIDGNNEKVFGMQDKFNKEVVFIRDAPSKMSCVLPQEHFQKMVTGEGIQISIKGGTAFNIQWQSHIIAGANRMFDYNDNAGQISRRVALFHFSKSLDQTSINDNLAASIISNELPMIVKKCIDFYHEKISIGKPFWAICPESLRDAQEDAMTVGNLVYRFLRAGPDENASLTSRCFVRRIVGKSTDWEVFKKAFEAYVRYKHAGTRWTLNVHETGPFVNLGYTLHRIKVCLACMGVAHVGCCSNYSNANRSTKWIIENMELVREDIAPIFDENDGVGDAHS